MDQLFFTSSLTFAITSLLFSIIVPLFGKRDVHKLLSFFNFLVSWWGFCLVGAAASQNNKESAVYWWTLSNAGGLLMAPVFCHFVIIFGNYRKYRLLIISYIGTGIYLLLSLLGLIDFRVRYVFNKFYYTSSGQFIYTSEAIYWCLCVIYGHWVLYKSYITAEPDKKIQIKYLFIAFFIGFAFGGLTHWLLVFGFNIHPSWNIFISLYVLLVTYAIFRHRLLGLDFAIRKGLVYTALLSIFTAAYFLLIVITEQVFQKSIGYRPVYSLIVMIAVIFTAEPLRMRLQKIIDYSFFKGNLPSISEEREKLQLKIEDQDRMRAVATLAAGMAHEIKNPLTSLKTFAHHLPKKYDDPNFRDKFSRIVVDEVDRINNIVKQLLDFSKPSPPKLRGVLISDLLDETLTLLSNNFLRNRIELKKDLDSYAMALADKNQLKQAFLNLFLNSIQSMPNGGQLSVTARTEQNRRITISLTDTGCGISKNQIKHVFDPFYTTKEDGSGLGLAIVHSIIEKHGGRIEIKSDEGKGTTVNVFLKSQD